jgi:hypothetical protein
MLLVQIGARAADFPFLTCAEQFEVATEIRLVLTTLVEMSVPLGILFMSAIGLWWTLRPRRRRKRPRK